MKVPNKQKPTQIAFNHSLGTDFKEFMNINRNCTENS